MSAEEMVVSPDGYKTKGGVPRGILIAIVVEVTAEPIFPKRAMYFCCVRMDCTA